jgi:hypothetical protein
MFGDATGAAVGTGWLDEVAWRYRSHCFQALGHAFQVRTTDPRLGAHLDEILGVFAVSCQPSAAPLTYSVYDAGQHDPFRYKVYAGDERVVATADPASVREWLLWHINRAVVARSQDDYLLVHASAVEHGGVAFVFPAPMESGKSTLAAGLVRAGFGYLSDEVAALDPETGWVVPFPRALSIDAGAWPVLPGLEPALDPAVRAYQRDQWQVPATAIRADAVAPPTPVGFVVVPRYEPGTASTLTPMHRAEAVQQLADNAFNFHRMGAVGLRLLATAVAGADCFRLRVGDLDEACDALRSLSADRPSPHGA